MIDWWLTIPRSGLRCALMQAINCFSLKYIGIGNEDIIGTVFEERYEMIYKAI